MTSNRVHRNALQPGYRLHWYGIEGRLGQGGFGITYLARDFNLDESVAIKEYLPIELAVRDSDFSVHPASENHANGFEWGRTKFIEEARTLARFRHPNIVRVRSVFEENNTAYMVMDYEHGGSLHDILTGHKTLEEVELLGILLPIMDGLQLVHEAGFIHRDIKPANIFIRADKSPVLLDFGSARQALGKETKNITSLVSPGYAPIEQYYSSNSEQGPWSDIYALAATLYRAMIGRAPQAALERSKALLNTNRDAFVGVEELARGRYSERFLRAVDHGLRFRTEERPRNLREWKREFEIHTSGPLTSEAVTLDVAQAVVPAPAALTPQDMGAASKAVPGYWRWMTWAMVAVAGLAAVGLLVLQQRGRPAAGSTSVAAPTATAVTENSGWKVGLAKEFASTTLLERQPDFSPDGRLIAFTRGHTTSDRNLFVQAIDSPDALQVTDDPLDKSAPAWSPDGSLIAFAIHEDGVPCRIAVMPFPKGVARDVGRCATAEWTKLSWMKAGNALIYSDKPASDVPNRIFKLSIATGQSKELVPPLSSGEGDVEPVVSPDGKFVLFVRNREKGSDLALLELGSGTVKILKSGFDIVTGGWSPDSRFVWFGENSEGGGSKVEVMRLADGTVTDVFVNTSTIGRIAGGQHGWLALSVTRIRSNLFYAPSGPQGAPAPVRDGFENVNNPTYSPSGDLAVVADRGQYRAVMVLEPNKEPREVANLGTDNARSMSWSPDGSRLAVATVRAGQAHLRIVRRDGLLIKEISLPGPDIHSTGWTAGDQVLVPLRDTDRWRLWDVDVSSGQVTSAGFSDGWDGVEVHGSKIFATHEGVSGLWRLDGGERKISEGAPIESQWGMIYGDDALYLKSGHPSLVMAQPLTGGPERVYATLPGRITSPVFDVDPKTSRVVYSVMSIDSDILLLEIKATNAGI